MEVGVGVAEVVVEGGAHEIAYQQFVAVFAALQLVLLIAGSHSINYKPAFILYSIQDNHLFIRSLIINPYYLTNSLNLV